MHPGKYPHKAAFTVPAAGFDDIGNPADGTTELGSTWVSVKPVVGNSRAFVTEAGDTALVSHQLGMMRPSFDIPTTAAITVGARVFDVQYLMDAPGAAEIIVMCAERQGSTSDESGV